MKLTDNRWLTGRGFGVHSPWAYDLIDNVIGERHPYYAYEDLYTFWEKAPQYMPQYPQSRDELLFRLVNRFNPQFILEVVHSSSNICLSLTISSFIHPPPQHIPSSLFGQNNHLE